MRALRIVALTTLASVAVACSDEEDLKDTRPGDSGDPSVTLDATGDDADTTADSTVAETSEIDSGAIDSLIIDSVIMEIGGDTGSGGETSVGDTDTATDTGVDTTLDTGTDSGVAIDSGGDAILGDTGITDAGITDIGVTDTGITDAGITDAGITDIGVTDTGVTDTGAIDSTIGDTATDSLFTDTAAGDTADVDTADVDTADADADLDTALDESGGAVDTGAVDSGADDMVKGASMEPSKPSWQLVVPTTTPGRHANLSWDLQSLTVKYDGLAANEWLDVYVSTGAQGSLASELLGSQRVLFAAPFDRGVHVRGDGLAQLFTQWGGKSWMAMPMRVDTVRRDAVLEVHIPFAVLGPATQLRVSAVVRTTNKEALASALYSESLIDGYSPAGAPKTIARFATIERR